MKYNRIVLKKTNKRDAAGFLLFVFLLPYVCASLWGHVGREMEKLHVDHDAWQAEEASACQIRLEMDWGVWEIGLEEYLVHKLASVMPEKYEPEALKAQAVLLRTEVIQAMKEQREDSLLITDDGADRWYKADTDAESYQVYRRAVEETDGLYLSFQGEPIQASYFQISNGQTRDASEVWDTDRRSYLRSVSCVQDKAAADYSSTVKISREDYFRILQGQLQGDFSQQELWENAVFTYDTAGYVTKVSFRGEGKEEEEIDGEIFRYLYHLPSAAFEMEQGEAVIFHVQGVGHGFGMSQYSANCMALNGKTYNQILQEFFYETELAKFE